MSNQIIVALIVLLVSLFATVITMTVIGEVNDRFKYKLDTLNLDYGESRFTNWQDSLNNIYKWTYSIPLFLMYVLVFWIFKVAIFEHEYSAPKQQERYEF